MLKLRLNYLKKLIQTQDLDILQQDLVDRNEANKQLLRQLEDVEEVYALGNNAKTKSLKYFFLMFAIECYNPHNTDESFKNKI